MENIQSLIDRLITDKKLILRSPAKLSWGDRETCEALFTSLFRRLDGSLVVFEHIPEYDQIVEWMTDTEGRGLLLIGDCGRGKSIIATCLVPVLLAMKQLYAYPVHADDLEKPYPFAASTMGMDARTTNLDYLCRCPFPVVDELGVEPLINDYGEKYEGFNRIINTAERYYRPVVASIRPTTVKSRSGSLSRSKRCAATGNATATGLTSPTSRAMGWSPKNCGRDSRKRRSSAWSASRPKTTTCRYEPM